MGRVDATNARLTAAGPACALATLSVFWLGVTAAGWNPLWRHEPLNLAEAAALRDAARVAHLIEMGNDPNRAQRIRGGVFDASPVVMTPVEAAVAADRPEILQLLLEYGAVVDAAAWAPLRCSARGPEVRALLDRLRPPAAEANCIVAVSSR